LVIVAGGLGLPPLRPTIYDIFRHRESFGRIEIVYGARTPKDLVFAEEVRTWLPKSDLRVQTTVDAAGRDWYGDVGVVTTRLPAARFDPANTTAFVCGPEIMMKLTAQALAERGVPSEAIWLSMERNMKCAFGFCGHCQYGPSFVCRDGPVLPYKTLAPLLAVKEV
jgi:NAD(P)H-flavin reductase